MRHNALTVFQCGQQVKQTAVPDTAVFDDLGHAVGEDTIRQCFQAVGIHQHHPGLIESTCKIFSCLQVYRHFAAHGGIHLCKQGGGDLDKVHTPENGSGSEACKIAYHTAAQRNDGVGAGEPHIHHLFPELCQNLRAFAGLSGGNLQQCGLKACKVQTAGKTGGIQGLNIAVCDNGGHAAFQNGTQQRTGLIQKPGFRNNVVFVAGDIYMEGFHTGFPMNCASAVAFFIRSSN